MEYLTLNNGVQMPLIGFGTWDVRGEQGKHCILEAFETGYRLIDTEQMYENEDIVGAAAKESGLARDEVFLTTKLYRPCANQLFQEAIRIGTELNNQYHTPEKQRGIMQRCWAVFRREL